MADQPIVLDQKTLDALDKLGGKGSAGNSVSAPASQPWVLMKIPEGAKPPLNGPNVEAPPGFAWYANPGYQAKPTAAAQPTMYGSAATGYYVIKPTQDDPYHVEQVVPANLPNADEEITKYLTREQNEQLRTQRQNNEMRGFGYATDDEAIKRSNESQQLGINLRDSLLKYKQLDENQRQFDVKQKTDDARAAQEILQSQATVGQIGATTARTGAETQQIGQNIDISKQKLPGELAQQAATLAGTEASTAASQAQTAAAQQAMKIAGVPQVQAPPTGMSQWTRDPLTGAITQGGINPEYQPKTHAEVNARVGQIQALMEQKQREVQAKVGTNGYTNDHALREFQTWYAQNVEPQKAGLQAAQEDAQRAAAIAEQQQRQQGYQTALGAGTQAISAFQAMQEGRVGPNYDKAMQAAGQGKFYGPEFDNAFTYEAADPQETSRQAVMDALKYISPTAAQANGLAMPSYSTIDIPQALNATSYMPGGGGGLPGPMAPPPAPVPVAPAPTAAPAMPPWLRADQMFGGAPQGNQMIGPGGRPAGWIDPNSPMFFGTYSHPGM